MPHRANLFLVGHWRSIRGALGVKTACSIYRLFLNFQLHILVNNIIIDHVIIIVNIVIQVIMEVNILLILIFVVHFITVCILSLIGR